MKAAILILSATAALNADIPSIIIGAAAIAANVIATIIRQ